MPEFALLAVVALTLCGLLTMTGARLPLDRVLAFAAEHARAAAILALVGAGLAAVLRLAAAHP